MHHKDNQRIKIAFIDRICAHYRIPIFQRLANLKNLDLILYYGDTNDPYLRSAKNISGFNNKKLRTLYFSHIYNVGRRYPVIFNPSLLFHLFKSNPDIIVFNESNILNVIFVLIYAKITSTPYILWGLGRVRSEKESIFRKILNPLFRYIVRNSSAILAYSSFAQNYYMSSYDGDSDKIFVIHNSMDTDQVFMDIEKYQPYVTHEKQNLGIGDEKVILFVGNFREGKRIENLILAYDRVRKQLKDTCLVLVGDGSERDKLQKLVKEKNIDNVVIFTGKKIEDVSLYFLIGDLFVLPGQGGLAIQQAMAHSLPIVTTPADGTELDLVIEGRNGFIVEIDNVDALSDAMVKVLQDEELRLKMGQNSRTLIEQQFNINNTINIIHSAILYVHRLTNRNWENIR